MMKRNWKRFLSAVLVLCLCASLAPAAFADNNVLGLPIEAITLTTTAQEQRNGSYSVTYTAKLSKGVGETYAQIVAVNKEDADKLKSLRFTCTLSDDLIKQMGNSTLSKDDFTFDGGDIFTFISASKGDNGITIQYKLNTDTVDDWKTAGTEAVHNAIMTSLTMTATRTVTAAQMNAALSGNSSITSTAKVELSAVKDNTVTDIPYFSGKQTAVAAQGTATMTIRYYSSGSGGGGSSSSGTTTTYPVEVSEQENGTVEVNYEKAGSGTTVTVNATPEDSYRVSRVEVIGADGTRVPVTANADGTCTFVMPEGEVEVVVTYAALAASPEESGVAAVLDTTDHGIYMVGYDNGLFGPDDNVTRAQVAQIFYCLLREKDIASSSVFTDVSEDAWYTEAVNVLAALGAVSGVDDGIFEPDRAITRAEFTAIAVRFAKGFAELEDTGVSFQDVPETSWAYPYISTAAAYGWVTGVGNDLFAPNDRITRAQAATIVNRMTGRLGDLSTVRDHQIVEFDDVSETHWAWYDIVEATTGHDYGMNADRTWEIWVK